MQLSLILSLSLLLMGVFSLLHISLWFDLNRQDKCYEDTAIPACDVNLQKIYILIFSSLCTIVVVFLQIFKSPKFFLLNAVVGAVAVLSVIIYFVATLVNDNFKDLKNYD